ncbi:hypothetical protein Avbf_10672 [Armadillidium vulgare]|nr:hypothetical protein Avbf_10672 [Armadillidium vulgare]
MKSFLILSFLFLQLCFVFGIDEAGCLAKDGGCYCAAAKECYIRAKETVFSYDEAVAVDQYFLHPFVMYTQPLVKDKCTCVHVNSETDFCVDDHCIHDESPVNVGCIIPAE